jgi:energy-converting hydrogenase Eha subunit F
MPPEGSPTPDLTALKIHFKSALFVLGADVLLKALLKLSAVVGLTNPGFRGLVDLVLNYFTGLAIIIFSVVAIVALVCNGWAAVCKALLSIGRN